MSRPNLKRPNSVIFPSKTDFVPNIRPITNSRSMTQLDTLQDGLKIDNVQPIKKWTYLDNSNKSSFPRPPDPAICINMDEPPSDKINFHAYQSKSSSLLPETVRPFVFKSVVTKQNSVDSLINKLEENASADYLVPNPRPIRNSQSMTQIDSLKDGFKFDKTQPVKKWSYFHNFNNSSSCSSDLKANINMNETLSDKANFPQYQPKSASIIKESRSPFVVKNVATKQNSTDSSINKIEEDTEAEMNFQTFSTIQKTNTFQGILQTKTEATGEITAQRLMGENEEKEKDSEASIINDKEDKSRKASLKNSESAQSIPENNEETKLEMCENNENMWEDENFLDDIWKSYVERPLLPLKPLQKQKSLSCTNLFQTIKGLSKKKAATNNRFSSPENTLFESKELCTSEANITNMPPRKISVESADKNIRSLSNGNEPFTIKRERQSLQNFPWYHFVDAKEASKRLLDMHRNGAFLIRPASNPTSEVLHTLCVVCLGRVYNFHIRNLKDGHITLSKKKEQKETFSSLLDMIKYHQTVPITINLAGEVVHVLLLITPSK